MTSNALGRVTLAATVTCRLLPPCILQLAPMETILGAMKCMPHHTGSVQQARRRVDGRIEGWTQWTDGWMAWRVDTSTFLSGPPRRNQGSRTSEGEDGWRRRGQGNHEPGFESPVRAIHPHQNSPRLGLFYLYIFALLVAPVLLSHTFLSVCPHAVTRVPASPRRRTDWLSPLHGPVPEPASPLHPVADIRRPGPSTSPHSGLGPPLPPPTRGSFEAISRSRYPLKKTGEDSIDVSWPHQT